MSEVKPEVLEIPVVNQAPKFPQKVINRGREMIVHVEMDSDYEHLVERIKKSAQQMMVDDNASKTDETL